MSLDNNHNGHGTLPPIHFEDLTINDMSDSSNRRYRKPPSEYEDQIWHLGWTDGRYGQPKNDNEVILRSRAKLSWQQKITVAEAEIGTTRASVKSMERPVERLRIKAQHAFDDHSKLLRDRSENPQAYSLSLWAIYWVTAMLLLAADLPLSLKLVALGYGVNTENAGEGSVDDLFKQPWYVITEFWEAMLLAVGVAIAGIFIKYLLDALVYREEQKSRSRVFVFTLIGVLALFLTTTILLGFFRADMQRQKSIEELTIRKNVLTQQRRPDRPSPELDQEVGKVENLIKEQESQGRVSVRTSSFILLTLLFPITGGICFSVGWRKLIKILNLRRAGKTLKKTEKDYAAQSWHYEQARSALESQTNKLARETADYATADDYAEMLVSLYRHGYMRGQNVPETIDAGTSLYERCEKAVARLLAGKMRAKSWDTRSSRPLDLN